MVDCFYTKESVAKSLCELINFNKYDLVVEPSAGTGSFLKYLPWSVEARSYDIDPKSPEIEKADFLELDTTIFKDFKKILVLGNPPFGKNSSLAIKFIKKCSLFAHSIAFILPKSFKKSSRSIFFPLNFHLVDGFPLDLDKNSFVYEENVSNVPCSFFYYTKKDFNRKIESIETSTWFSFVNDPDEAHFAFRRVGASAGNFYFEELNLLSKESNYFLQWNDYLRDVSNISFHHNNTVGPKSISKKELVNALNRVL